MEIEDSSNSGFDTKQLPPWGPEPVDLKGRNFHEEEKRWFAQQINEKLDTPVNLAKRFNLVHSTLCRWAKADRKMQPLRNRGKPSLLSSRGIGNIRSKVEECPRGLLKTKFEELVYEEMKREATLLGKSDCKVAQPHRTTIYRLQKVHDLYTGFAEKQTDPRIGTTKNVGNI